MLNEADKLFERVIANRLTKHLRVVGPDLSDNQFGFRVGRSTIDAIKRVKTYSEGVVAQGGVVLAVSLDIANAFNTMPWSCVREALKYHGVPLYLRRIVGAYLSERYVSYPGRDGHIQLDEVSCGVPQGSVLGPLLWNIGYDWVLRGTDLSDANVTCYADDTLVMARGRTYEIAARLVTIKVSEVVQKIELLGLKVALNKTEAMCFHGPRKAPARGSYLSIGGIQIEVGANMKYLGLILDSRWSFREHFTQMVPRLMRATAAFKRILPNLGGPKAGIRRLYLGVVRSMALYGTPIWAKTLTERNVALLRRPQRVMAVGVIRGYRTVSFEAACLLAGSPPWDLEARLYADMFEWRMELRIRGEFPPLQAIERWKLHARLTMREEWKVRLAAPKAGIKTIEAIRPILMDWLDRTHGNLTFRLVQVLTGHGCFGKYLHQIAKREPSARCHHCRSDEDTAQHTLEVCPAWENERRDLVTVVGADLSLPTLLKTMVESERAWDAGLTFCEEVLTQKEVAEREREASSNLPMRKKRAGRRRRLFFNALLRPP